MAAKLKVKVGDTVMVIAGEDKNKKENTGKVQKVFPETGRIIVEGMNMVKKHQKPRGQGMPGGIIEKEAPIDASNVMVICPKCGKATRVSHKVEKVVGDNGKASRSMIRICKKCGAEID